MAKAPCIRTELEKAWRLATAPIRLMPTWVLAGAPKCGTSTLYDYLVDDPGAARGARKEPTNFIHYPGSRLRSSMNFPIRLGRRRIVGDGSVEYFAHPDGPRNVREVLPDARLIFILRDPVKRAWSDFRMFQKDGRERGEFLQCVKAAAGWLNDPELQPLVDAASRQAVNPIRYLLCGMYARCLERWFAEFPREQCLILTSEEFFDDPLAVAAAARRHVGIPEPPTRLLAVARDGGRVSVPGDAEAFLQKFFAPENERLSQLLGRELPWAQ